MNYEQAGKSPEVCSFETGRITWLSACGYDLLHSWYAKISSISQYDYDRRTFRGSTLLEYALRSSGCYTVTVITGRFKHLRLQTQCVNYIPLNIHVITSSVASTTLKRGSETKLYVFNLCFLSTPSRNTGFIWTSQAGIDPRIDIQVIRSNKMFPTLNPFPIGPLLVSELNE